MVASLVYQDDMVQVWHGDARDTHFADGSVPLVITDPPYNKRKKYPGFKDWMSPEEYEQFSLDWLKEAKRILRDDGSMYFSCSGDMMFRFREMLDEVGLRFFQLLIWHRPNFFAVRLSAKIGWSFHYEPIFWCGKRKRPSLLSLFKGTDISNSDVLTFPSPQTNWKKERRVFVVQKPEGLYRTLIAKTPGDPVVDLFLGSGTSLAAAVQLGRKGIGYDIDEKACRLAIERLQMVQRGFVLKGGEDGNLSKVWKGNRVFEGFLAGVD